MENCENLKKMSFKGLEKRARIFSPYVAILRYIDLACLPLYIIIFTYKLDKTPIFVAKKHNYDIFVAKIYDYALDSF